MDGDREINGRDGQGSPPPRSAQKPPLRSALKPINVARPSNLPEGSGIRVFSDDGSQQSEGSDAEVTTMQNAGTPHLESQPTMPCYHTPHGAEAPPRKVLSFAPSRFKPPSAFSRLRQSEAGGAGGAGSPGTPGSPRTPRTPRTQGKYDMFKTKSRKFSGPLERQISRAISRRRPEESSFEDVEKKGDSEQQLEQEENGGGMKTALSAGRYFDALSGPELEDVKETENLLLPADEKWPFLLRFPIGCFGVALGLGSQSILWKALAQTKEMTFIHVPLWVNFYLWCLALLALVVIFVTYFLKIVYYFEAVRREYHHPVRVNFFFAPWIAAMFLAIGVPPAVAKTLHPAVWCVFMLPILVLELKIYGQWLSGGQRRLSKVANPSTHLSVVGNFVGSILAATVGWKEPAIFFWAVGLAHYLVLFVTLYQRLPTNETLPKDLHPVFFLFVAAPSAASVAWMRIVGEFDYVSRLVFFIALFLYSSLIVRINFFRGFKFSISWWAYTFPMTAAAIAAIQYAHVATSWITRGLALALSVISSATVFTLFISTLLHVFVWKCLFPNDLAIAITAYKPKTFVHKSSENDDGCGLYSLQHSEPLYKSIVDAYHQFLAARAHHEVCIDQSKTLPAHLDSAMLVDGSVNGILEDNHLLRSSTV